jgi:GxxExxY protein
VTARPLRHEDAKIRRTEGRVYGNGFRRVPEGAERAAREVVDAAYNVHKKLGPGLLESVYERCLCYELRKRSVTYRAQMPVPVLYDGVFIDAGLRLDLIVENEVVIEIKSVENLRPVFTAQLLTYLKLTGLRLGLLINFNVPLIRDGIHRIVR